VRAAVVDATCSRISGHSRLAAESRSSSGIV
jgi:hypothetical protein